MRAVAFTTHALLLSFGLGASGVASASGAAREPWQLGRAMGAPDWLRFDLDHRMRFEHVADDPRTPVPGDRSALSLRTLLSVQLDSSGWFAGAELLDARAVSTDGTPLSTGIVNALEPLQIYLGLRGAGIFAAGDAFELQLGRMTLDLGSRRLVARNEFRNTINAFTGASAKWTSARRDLVRVFAVFPVSRRPSAAEALESDEVQLDLDNTRALLSGAYFGSRPLVAQIELDAYFVAYTERDGPQIPSANRNLLTPGLRLVRPPQTEGLDFELEAMVQLGASNASARSEDTTALEHRALFAHASLGYRFALWARPRFVVQYDYATGDLDPNDGRNERFDSLFGARRFELGPTGLLGAVARANLSSPSLRIELWPHDSVDVLLAHRPVWLASARDLAGADGRFVGHQVELRLRWQPLRGNLSFEIGGALLARQGSAVIEGQPSTSLYGYGQITGHI